MNERAQYVQIFEIRAGIVIGRFQNEGGVREARVLGDAAQGVAAEVAFADMPVAIDA